MTGLRHGFEALGIEIVRVMDEVHATLDGGAAGITGGVPGGIVSLLADLAGSGVIALHSESIVSTTSMSVDFVQPAIGRLVACGRLVRLGQSLGFAQVSVLDGANAVVSQGMVVARIHRSSELGEARRVYEGRM